MDKSNTQYYCNKYGHFESERKKKQVDLNKCSTNVSSTNEGTTPSMFPSCSTTQKNNNEDV